ncbi:MAG: DegV family protein [Chloroflexi bacterium]|nr:DegV family protein [Chloroflexota bacterium]
MSPSQATPHAGTPRQQVAILTDSTASLPPEAAQKHRITVVPLEITLDGRTYQDGVELAPDQFYALLPGLKDLPKTSSPRPASFLAAFQEAGQWAQQVLCLTLSARLSATYDAARAAASLARETMPHLEVQVLDTGTAGGAEALVALKAAEVAAQGADLKQVAAVAQRTAEQVQFLGVLETLYYVWKGGHIPKVALWASSLLQVKPILDIQRGEVHLVARPRSRARALDQLVGIMKERAGGARLRVNVMHAAAPEEAEALKCRILKDFPCTSLLVSTFTPVIGAHTGPGLLAVAFLPDL